MKKLSFKAKAALVSFLKGAPYVEVAELLRIDIRLFNLYKSGKRSSPTAADKLSNLYFSELNPLPVNMTAIVKEQRNWANKTSNPVTLIEIIDRLIEGSEGENQYQLLWPKAVLLCDIASRPPAPLDSQKQKDESCVRAISLYNKSIQCYESLFSLSSDDSWKGLALMNRTSMTYYRDKIEKEKLTESDLISFSDEYLSCYLKQSYAPRTCILNALVTASESESLEQCIFLAANFIDITHDGESKNAARDFDKLQTLGFEDADLSFFAAHKDRIVEAAKDIIVNDFEAGSMRAKI